MENENIEFDNMQAEAQAESNIMPMAIEEQNYYVDFDHLQKYHEKLKGIISRPVYYKLQGDVMTDIGGVGESYTLAKINLTPQNPAPIVGDTVVFNTSESVYIGTVTQAQSAAVLVVVKMEVKGGGGEVTSGVTSVNGRDGDVVLAKSDVGLGNVANVDTTNATNITSGTLAKARLSSDVIASLGKADTALQSITASGSQGVTASASGNKVTVTGVKASSSAYGVVKVYVDSSGYLCIDT